MLLISNVSSVFPKFLISNLRISTESFGLTVIFVFVSIFPSILIYLHISGAKVTVYLSGLSIFPLYIFVHIFLFFIFFK